MSPVLTRSRTGIAEFCMAEILNLSDLDLSERLRRKKGEQFWSTALQNAGFHELLKNIVQHTGWQEARVPAKLAALYSRLSEHILSHKFPRSDTAVLLAVGEFATEGECRSLEALAHYFGVLVERQNGESATVSTG